MTERTATAIDAGSSIVSHDERAGTQKTPGREVRRGRRRQATERTVYEARAAAARRDGHDHGGLDRLGDLGAGGGAGHVARLDHEALLERAIDLGSTSSAFSRITSETSEMISALARSSIRFSRNDRLFDLLRNVRLLSTSAMS